MESEIEAGTDMITAPSPVTEDLSGVVDVSPNLQCARNLCLFMQQYKTVAAVT